MDTLFPEEIDHVTYGPDFRPLEGDRLVSLDSKNDVTCILRYAGGQLHGERAVEACTGYSETWERGFFVSADLHWARRQPKRRDFPKQDRESRLDRIKYAFENLNREDPARFLPVLGEETYLPGFEPPDLSGL